MSEIIYPAGQTIVSGTIAIQPNVTHVSGAGEGITTFKRHPTFHGPIFSTNTLSSSSLLFEKMTIDGDIAHTPENAVLAMDIQGYNTTIKNVSIIGWRHVGIALRKGGCRIINCSIYGENIDIGDGQGIWCDNNMPSGSTIEVRENNIKWWGLHAVAIYGRECNAIIEGNIIHDNHKYSSTGGGQINIGNAAVGTHSDIFGNHIYSQPVVAGSGGIELNQGSHNVYNNLIHDISTAAIGVDSRLTQTNIYNNQIYNCGRQTAEPHNPQHRCGIFVGWGADNLNIHGNRIYDNQTPKTTVWAVILEGGTGLPSTNINISQNNDFRGCIQQGIGAFNSPTGALKSKFMAPISPRWVEFPAYDSAVPNGVFFVAELDAVPPPAAYTSDRFPVVVTLTSETQGIDIYYTKDGSIPHGPPNPHGTLYGDAAKPSMQIGQTLKAIGTRAGMLPSPILSGAYTQSRVEVPVFNPPIGDYTPDEFPVLVTITCPTPDAVIRYVINDSNTPVVTPNSAVYVSPVHVPPNKYLHAKAFKVFYLPSSEWHGQYHQKPQCAIPTLAPDGGAYPASQYEPHGLPVTATSPTSGSSMRFTINNPDVEHGGVIQSPKVLRIQPDDVLYLIAQKAGYENSHTKIATYTTTIQQVAKPTIHPQDVTLTGNHHSIDVTLDCSTPSVAMRYVIVQAGDNTQPTRSVGTLINDTHAVVHIGPPDNNIGHRVLRVIAFRADMEDSDIAESYYEHDGGGGG